MLGDDYINQQIWQAYRDYVEMTSCRTYLTDTARSVEALLYRSDARPRWYDIIEAMDGTEQPEPPQEESAEEIMDRMMARINGKT